MAGPWDVEGGREEEGRGRRQRKKREAGMGVSRQPRHARRGHGMGISSTLCQIHSLHGSLLAPHLPAPQLHTELRFLSHPTMGQSWSLILSRRQDGLCCHVILARSLASASSCFHTRTSVLAIWRQGRTGQPGRKESAEQERQTRGTYLIDTGADSIAGIRGLGI